MILSKGSVNEISGWIIMFFILSLKPISLFLLKHDSPILDDTAPVFISNIFPHASTPIHSMLYFSGNYFLLMYIKYQNSLSGICCIVLRQMKA